MPDFQGTKAIILQPGDVMVPYTFTWTVCTASTGNDGAIPFGHSISSVVTVVKHESGLICTTGILTTSSCSGGVVSLFMNYPTSSSGYPVGKYHVTFTATISDGATTYTKEFDFNRLLVKNL
jgi:hypothetical protein